MVGLCHYIGQMTESAEGEKCLPSRGRVREGDVPLPREAFEEELAPVILRMEMHKPIISNRTMLNFYSNGQVFNSNNLIPVTHPIMDAHIISNLTMWSDVTPAY